MMGNPYFAAAFVIAAIQCSPIACAQSPTSMNALASRVGLEQRLGEQVPLDLQFVNEEGERVLLGELVKHRPVVLSLVYFRCPMLCTQVLNGLLKSSQAMSLELGNDFQIVSLSIDPREDFSAAQKKKERYVSAYRRPGADEGWHFLTGQQAEIDRLANTVGYRYEYDSRSDQYAHPSGIVILTPDGRISRYLYGIDYSPRDLRLALVESSAGQIGTPVDQILLLCFHYDPATGKYGLIVSRVLQLAGTATALALGCYLWAMFRLERRRMAIPTPTERIIPQSQSTHAASP